MECFSISVDGVEYDVTAEEGIVSLFKVMHNRHIYKHLCNDWHIDLWQEIDLLSGPLNSVPDPHIDKLGYKILNHYLKFYIYLSDEDYVKPWINGGRVPLSFNTKYLAADQKGIFTPDEKRQKFMSQPPEVVGSMIKIGADVNRAVGNGNVIVRDGVKYPLDLFQYQEEVIILCMANVLSKNVADCLSDDITKKVACVEIVDLYELVNAIELQLGLPHKKGQCNYTDDSSRGHFLKSIESACQEEYRIIWPFDPKDRNRFLNKWITIPKGISTRVYW